MTIPYELFEHGKEKRKRKKTKKEAGTREEARADSRREGRIGSEQRNTSFLGPKTNDLRM